MCVCVCVFYHIIVRSSLFHICCDHFLFPPSFRICFHNVNELQSYRLGYVIDGCTGSFVFWMDPFWRTQSWACSSMEHKCNISLTCQIGAELSYKSIRWIAAHWLTDCTWARKVKIILSPKWTLDWIPFIWKETPHKNLTAVFLDILLFDELEGTCLVCEWALTTAWCQNLSFYPHRGVQE